MTDEQKIKGAAAILMREMGRLGEILNERDAVRIARQMYDIWRERYEVRTLPPGTVAQRHRQRCSERDSLEAQASVYREEPTPVTTEQLDKLQFGQSLHTRPDKGGPIE